MPIIVRSFNDSGRTDRNNRRSRSARFSIAQDRYTPGSPKDEVSSRARRDVIPLYYTVIGPRYNLTTFEFIITWKREEGMKSLKASLAS